MPPLKNTKHEKFAHALVEGKNQTEAYQKVYGVSANSAGASAPVVLDNPSVRQRVSELLDRDQLGLPHLVSRLKQHVYSENEGIALKAVEDGFKLHGAFDEEKTEFNVSNINVVFENATPPDEKKSS